MAWSQLDLICRAMVWNYDDTTPSDSRMYMGLDRQIYQYNVASDYYEFIDYLDNLKDESETSIEDILGNDDDITDYQQMACWEIHWSCAGGCLPFLCDPGNCVTLKLILSH